ncbi:sulfotransferase [Thiocystis violacea]|uniref:sulfotransferase n=1 Tax=Thiocystis violacea TaxID=13725 RepID=UPI00190739C9|nr:sulfotransferase [Thiocystis violacea]MBK1721486.1 hypothetical protein [Thiocystis violacea]
MSLDYRNYRFVIGIGSQRAGSTLLHSLLDKASNVFMHPVKELHYFDTLNGYRSSDALKQFSERQLAREIDHIVTAPDTSFTRNKRYRCYLRTNKILSRVEVNEVDYLDLFRPNLAEYKLLGEVTPEYMLLDSDAIARMRDIVGESAAIVMICRNPVKRILSAVKLMSSYNNLQFDDASAGRWLSDMLSRDSSWLKAQDGYNDYEAAIERFSRFFSRFIAVSYDDLVADPGSTADALSRALEIRISTHDFVEGARKVTNSLGVDFSFGEGTIAALSDRYADAERFLRDYFGVPLHC